MYVHCTYIIILIPFILTTISSIKKKLAFGKVSANQLKPINIIHDQTQLYHQKSYKKRL